ncbi:MAG: sodium:calcium antiporter, partial [Ileibacterium sp.]|nr:sodium:calcium antiporter [Ileibacterium sp.]
MEYLLLIVGFAFLIKGADAFVDGAVSVAYKFHISPTIVGLTIVALGTSLPEAAVSIS